MPNLVLFDNGSHRNIMLEDATGIGLAVQANQHLIIDNQDGILLDPGGHKVYAKVMRETMAELGKASLAYIFLSHQCPDVVAACNGWLMTTDAIAYIPELWVRFVPHFGVDHLVEDRLLGIPDNGMNLPLGDMTLNIIPAHYLHSVGNHQLYDPVAKILYSGDLGASLGQSYVEVQDFDAHLPFMEGFHRRYMVSSAVMSAWAKMARTLDVEIIAPQHGAIFRGREMVTRFIDWADGFRCGTDFLDQMYPAR